MPSFDITSEADLVALKNAALSLRQLKRYVEALAMYNELVAQFGNNIPPEERKMIREYDHQQTMQAIVGTEGGREVPSLPVVEGEYDREESPRTRNPEVRERLAKVTDAVRGGSSVRCAIGSAFSRQVPSAPSTANL